KSRNYVHPSCTNVLHACRRRLLQSSVSRICSSASLLSGEGRHGRGTDELAGGARLRRNRTPRPLVGNAVGGFLGVVGVHRLFHLGGVPRRALHLWPVPVAVLFA